MFTGVPLLQYRAIHANVVYAARVGIYTLCVYVSQHTLLLCYIMCVNAINTDTHERFHTQRLEEIKDKR